MVNFKENEELKTLNHSCAHLMAQAIKHLYPQAKFWVGPVVAEGFYYDVDLGEDVIRDEDIEKIEKEMKKIAKSGKKIMRREVSKAEAMEMFQNDEYKLDLISDLEEGGNRAALLRRPAVLRRWRKPLAQSEFTSPEHLK